MKPKQHKALTQLVSEGLFYVWDPIGVSDRFGVRDEYADYVEQLVGLLSQGAQEERVADHLQTVSRQFGLGASLKKTRATARFVCDGARWIFDSI